MPALVPAAVPATASINPWTCDGVTVQRIPNPTLQAVPPAEAERSSDWSSAPSPADLEIHGQNKRGCGDRSLCFGVVF